MFDRHGNRWGNGNGNGNGHGHGHRHDNHWGHDRHDNHWGYDRHDGSRECHDDYNDYSGHDHY